MEPVRVLHLVSTFAVKTDTKWLAQLVRHIPSRRVASSIACMYAGGPMRQTFQELGLRTFNLEAGRTLSPMGLLRLLGLIRTLRPHIVHTHLLRADLYGGLAGRLAGVPIVLTTQYAVWPFSRVTVRGCDGVIDRACRALATHALCVSEAVRRDLLGRIGWRPDRAFTIHTGMDFENWLPEPSARVRLRAEWGVSPDAPVVMTVARLAREKGLDVLIDAADRVCRARPDARFIIVGDGPLAASLAARIRDTGLENTVRLAGFHRDIPSTLSAADLFVLPSYMEGMPNAVLEAFAAGLPVVASAVGGLPEVIEHEKTGLLVPVKDPHALASAVTRLLQDKAAACAMARAGQAAARARFAIADVAEAYAALYTNLARSGGACEQTCARGASHRPALGREVAAP